MRHEDYKELLALEAAGAPDAGERRTLEGHLSSCAECRAELRELSDAAAALAFTLAPVAPPAHLRSRVLEQVRGLAPSTQTAAARETAEVVETSEAAREITAVGTGARRPAVVAEEARGLLARLSLWQLLAARPSLAFGAAAAAVAFALLGATALALWGRNAVLQSEVTRLYDRLHQSQEEVARSHDQLARTRDVSDLLSSPEASVARLAGKEAAPRARALIAYDSSTGRAVLLAHGLPPAPAGRAYQLWLIADKKPMPGGTFKSDAGGSARMNDRLPAGMSKPTFAVTLEREGGESAPKGEMYLLGSAS
jgi:anti-sigma-K factor RskA